MVILLMCVVFTFLYVHNVLRSYEIIIFKGTWSQSGPQSFDKLPSWQAVTIVTVLCWDKGCSFLFQHPVSCLCFLCPILLIGHQPECPSIPHSPYSLTTHIQGSTYLTLYGPLYVTTINPPLNHKTQRLLFTIASSPTTRPTQSLPSSQEVERSVSQSGAVLTFSSWNSIV